MGYLPSLKKVLIVADDSRSAERMNRVLSAGGFVATANSSMRDCVKNAAIFLPNVVLMSVDAHRDNGCAEAVKLRKISGLEKVHLVALTITRDAESLCDMAKAGFDELLPPAPSVQGLVISCR